MNINTWTIRKKLNSLSILGIIFSIGIAITGFYGVMQTGQAMDMIAIDLSITRTHLTADMMHDALRADVFESFLLASDEEDNREEKALILKEVREHAGLFREMIAKNEELVTAPAIDKALTNVESDLASYIFAAEEIVELAFSDMKQAKERLPAFIAEFDRLAIEMKQISQLIEDEMHTTSKIEKDAISSSKNLIIGISFLVIVILSFFSKQISFSIIEPIRKLSEASEKIGNGDFNVELDTTGKDGIAILARGFSLMIEKLKTASHASASTLARAEAMLDGSHANMIFANNDLVIEYMNPASLKALKKIEHLLPVPADQIVGTCIDRFHADPGRVRGILSNEHMLPHTGKITLGDQTLELIAVAIHDQNGDRIGQMATWAIDTEKTQMESALKDTSSSVSSASEELSAASQEMKEQSVITMEAAKEALSASLRTDENVGTVAAAAEEMADTVTEISKNVQEATQITNNAVIMSSEMNNKIAKLAESSREIGQVVKVINTIAGKTNLLALNATIEAARAGEAGKGFAVVASEVKDLASATANATGEIQEKIKAIQDSTIEAVEAIKKIGEIVEKTNEISTTIAGAVEEQAATTGEITRNMLEAARGAKEVSTYIEKISTNSQSMNEGTENVLSASMELSKISGDLVNLISDPDAPESGGDTATSKNGARKTPVHA